nr:inner membrane CreD family protein [Chitinophagales bacterium]
VNTTNDYQKAMRSVKYAILTIGLTFLVFFLVEIINGNRIHPFQYILVGLALSLFYVLLISISEHIDFNIAYLIAAAVIVTMITLYSLAVFSQKKLSVLLFFILSGLYGFLFVILQANDYALLLGSIGLVIMLALTMYLTRKINWYQVKAHVA